MALSKINPTTTESWKKLQAHFSQVQPQHLKTLFKENPNRASEFSIHFEDFFVDYSKNRITQETMDLLLELAEEVELKEAIDQYFQGENINETEGRAVLHTALRAKSEAL